MNVFLTLQDISTCTAVTAHPDVPAHINDVVFDVKKHITSILGSLSQKFELQKNDGSTQEYSLVDIRNFRNMNVADLKSVFLINFGLDFDKAEDMKKINGYYQESIDIIKNRYGRSIEPILQAKKIESANDIKEMLDITGKGKKGVQICAISKIFLSLALLRKDPRITYIDKIHTEITNDILAPFSNKKEIANGLESGNILIDEKENKIIPAHLIHRAKDIASGVGKQMGNINYNSVDDFKDLHGFTIEIDSQEKDDMIFVLQKYYFILLEKAKKKSIDCETLLPEIEIENKDMISSEDIVRLENQLDPDFYDFLLSNIYISEIKNSKKRENKGTAKSYKDIKLTLKYKTKDPSKSDHSALYSGTEVKVTQKGNENEKGLSFHGIFDYKKRFREMTRVFGFIHREDILFFVNEFFQTLDTKLLKKGKDRSIFFQELISDLKNEVPELIENNFKYIPHDTENLKEIQKILYKYLLKEVVEVKISKSSKHTFFVHKSYFDLTPELNKEVFPV